MAKQSNKIVGLVDSFLLLNILKFYIYDLSYLKHVLYFNWLRRFLSEFQFISA